MEHPSIIFKIVCPDRPGLVSLLTSWISNYGGNIKHSDHHTDQDAGLFLSRIEWDINSESFNRDEIYKEFEKIADEVNGQFNVNYSDEIPNVATGHAPSTYIFAGMGAFVAGCSRTPITAMFLAFALTKNLLIMKPVLISCIASFLVARAFNEESIYERQIQIELED